MEPGDRCHGMESNPTECVWSKYTASVTGTGTGTTEVTTTYYKCPTTCVQFPTTQIRFTNADVYTGKKTLLQKKNGCFGWATLIIVALPEPSINYLAVNLLQEKSVNLAAI